ncbi:MAG: ATP-binding protein, partial [Gammaproteobacteria bacterium]|nr:ATP-binding protein [Gammaproteobacteria bacterium]
GSSFFLKNHLLSNNTHHNESHKNEDIVFANHALLFGIAGILFESSVIWDAGWWWWHILRLLAYLVVLIYFLSLFKEQQDTLTRNELKLNNVNKDLEQRVYERTKELEKANQAKSEFLSSMSHELRTPMNAILGFAQLITLDKKPKSNYKSYADEILSAGDHLLELINKILDLSIIEEKKLDVNMEDTNISKIISDSVATMYSIAEQSNIQLINNIPAESHYIVRVDNLRLKQVILNLLSNAIKYNQKNGKVDISINVTDDKIRISFKDTGIGISKEKQEKLFTPFERLGFEGNVIEGAGIGLVLSKKLMKLMNGTIGVQSTSPAQGSTFYIELPYKPQ